jgi:hypothetical protein
MDTQRQFMPSTVRLISKIQFRLVIIAAIILYFMVVVALSTELKENRIYIASVIVVNITILLAIGHYMIRSILFPYSNYFIRTQMDSVINQKFS